MDMPDIRPILLERLRNGLKEDGFTDEQIEEFLAWMDKRVKELWRR